MVRIMNEEPDVTGVPDSLRPVIIECLDKDPGRRPKARDIMFRLVDPSAPYPQQTLLTPGRRAGKRSLLLSTERTVVLALVI
jgi:hypothetical protein